MHGNTENKFDKFKIQHLKIVMERVKIYQYSLIKRLNLHDQSKSRNQVINCEQKNKGKCRSKYLLMQF